MAPVGLLSLLHNNMSILHNKSLSLSLYLFIHFLLVLFFKRILIQRFRGKMVILDEEWDGGKQKLWWVHKDSKKCMCNEKLEGSVSRNSVKWDAEEKQRAEVAQSTDGTEVRAEGRIWKKEGSGLRWRLSEIVRVLILVAPVTEQVMRFIFLLVTI